MQGVDVVTRWVGMFAEPTNVEVHINLVDQEPTLRHVFVFRLCTRLCDWLVEGLVQLYVRSASDCF